MPKKEEVKELDFKSTAEVDVPKKLVDQVLGQDNSVDLIKKAAAQKRNVLLVGLPGTGKSMIAQAMAEILPVGKLTDVLIYPNKADPNNPKVRVVRAGEGKKILEQATLNQAQKESGSRFLGFVLPLGWFILAAIMFHFGFIGEITFAALLILGGFILVGFALGSQIRTKGESEVPKLLIDNTGKKIAPFIEATGARAGSLLGDVRHDPLQSFIDEDKFVVKRNSGFVSVSFEQLWNEISSKYKNLVEKHENDYEAIVLPKEEEIYIYGFKDGKVVLSRILSLNRRPFEDEVVDLEVNGSKLTVTPEHKIFGNSDKKEAKNVSEKDELITLQK